MDGFTDVDRIRYLATICHRDQHNPTEFNVRIESFPGWTLRRALNANMERARVQDGYTTEDPESMSAINRLEQAVAYEDGWFTAKFSIAGTPLDQNDTTPQIKQVFLHGKILTPPGPIKPEIFDIDGAIIADSSNLHSDG